MAHTSSSLLHLDVLARAESVPQVRSAVRQAVDGLVRDVHAVCVAVTEAVANVVTHAYRAMPRPGVVEVDVELEDGTVRVSVADQGGGIVPRTDSPGLGLGMPLMTALADRVEIGGTDDGGRVCLWFGCSDAAAGGH